MEMTNKMRASKVVFDMFCSLVTSLLEMSELNLEKPDEELMNKAMLDVEEKMKGIDGLRLSDLQSGVHLLDDTISTVKGILEDNILLVASPIREESEES